MSELLSDSYKSLSSDQVLLFVSFWQFIWSNKFTDREGMSVMRTSFQGVELFYCYEDVLYDSLREQARWTKSCDMIGGQDGAFVPARDFSLGSARSKIIFWCFIPFNPLLTKFVQSRWLDIGVVLGLWTRKKELGGYPAILTSRFSWSITWKHRR